MVSSCQLRRFTAADFGRILFPSLVAADRTSMQEYLGKVGKRPYATGSKSAHHAVTLETSGGEFLLRRQGGNPFRDPALDKLVGKRVRFRGRTEGNLLIVSDWDEVPDD
jgi:hypothetical protein